MSHSDEEFWWYNPSSLIEPSLIPRTYGLETLVNFMTKMVILIVLFGTVFYYVGGSIASSASIATLIYIISIQLILNPPKHGGKESCEVEMIDQRTRNPSDTVSEGFEDLYKASPIAQFAPYKKTPGFMNPYEGPVKIPEIPRFPTIDNPFANMMVPDILNKPGGFAAVAPLDDISYDDFFRTSWHSDPTDVFGKSQSQRQFYTVPSTSVPSDRDSYQKWLYGNPNKTCKEGNKKACIASSEGGKLPWRSMI